MLKFESGIFGSSLRLLAREVYDKCSKQVGIGKVALITGEEKSYQAQQNILFAQLSSCRRIKM